MIKNFVRRITKLILRIITIIVLIWIWVAAFAFYPYDNLDLVGRTVYKSCQSTNIQYNSWDPYCLIIKQNLTIKGIKYKLWIVKSVEETYWYMENLEKFNSNSIDNIQTNWTENWVELKIDKSTKFIEKSMFIWWR